MLYYLHHIRRKQIMKRYDAIIIGFGKGGKTLAGYLAKQGEHVAIIEKSKEMYGGTCINEGCIPSKSLIIQANQHSYTKAIMQKETLIQNYAKRITISYIILKMWM